jgi:hypothetical protein
MACEQCHYFRGINNTPFGRCHNHPHKGKVFYDDGDRMNGTGGLEFIVNRLAAYPCEIPPSTPRPWEVEDDPTFN